MAVTKYKQQGNCHELAVALKVSELGGSVAWPYGDGQPYDLIADFGGKVSRVQVKGTHSVKKCGSAHVNLKKGSRRNEWYDKNDCDMMIVCTPLGNYVIPVNELKWGVLTTWPIGTKPTPPRYEPWREAWHLLK